MKMSRTASREQAFILIFEKSFNDDALPDLIESAKLSRDLADDEFMERLANGTFENIEYIDSVIEKNCIGWSKNRVSKVALAVMRLCCYEIFFENDIPTSVSIDQAVELAKKFASEEDASFINGVLGSIVKFDNTEKE